MSFELSAKAECQIYFHYDLAVATARRYMVHDNIRDKVGHFT
jgi:hypothetical protein